MNRKHIEKVQALAATIRQAGHGFSALATEIAADGGENHRDVQPTTECAEALFAMANAFDEGAARLLAQEPQ